MNLDERLAELQAIMQHDIGDRGLARVPEDNLITRTATDFAAACRSIAETENASVGIITGFLIPTATPPRAETDGPLGAIHLARVFAWLGIPVVLAAEPFCSTALRIGLKKLKLQKKVRVIDLDADSSEFEEVSKSLTHLIALERVGPSHTPASIARKNSGDDTTRLFLETVNAQDHDRLHTMRGIDITESMTPAHRFFENTKAVTIGIGDGGNEIGMGKIPWSVIHANIANGGRIACRIATDHLIVAGISNWGAYALGFGVAFALNKKLPFDFFDIATEFELLELLVRKGELIDGKTGQATATVDGVSYMDYAMPLNWMGISYYERDDHRV